MNSVKTLLGKRENWVALILALTGSIVFELYARSCGFMLTSDSIQYLAASASFKQQGKLLCADGSYYSYWQPLFPVILSITSDPLLLLVWINIICKFIIALVLLSFSDSIFKNPFIKISFLISSMLSVYVVMISVFVWSELVFMSLLYLNTFFALATRKSQNYYWMVATGFLLCIQRNAGLFWISGVCVWLLLDQEYPIRKRFICTAIFFFISTSGLWAWNIYNTYFLTADFSFYNHPFFRDWYYNLKLVLETIGKMILPMKPGIMLVICSLLGTVTIVFVLRKESSRSLLFFATTLLVYSLGFVLMVKLDKHDMDRYFSVITPHIFLFFFLSFQKLSELNFRGARFSAWIFVLLWLLYPLTRTINNVIAWHERSCSTENTSIGSHSRN